MDVGDRACMQGARGTETAGQVLSLRRSKCKARLQAANLKLKTLQMAGDMSSAEPTAFLDGLQGWRG